MILHTSRPLPTALHDSLPHPQRDNKCIPSRNPSGLQKRKFDCCQRGVFPILVIWRMHEKKKEKKEREKKGTKKRSSCPALAKCDCDQPLPLYSGEPTSLTSPPPLH
ncbi:hypothetical protein I7I53_05628 [Histoplasma capsulatum var. duboisii H88]|uniref:Uncharacterized protein n=1 Tax=Ajellomyces capsulatus (strain H88) TaxID=544711 RepID=A0A8A1LVI5_AJEC8|nr:hypothetical protein I7I53_05628 [Histoplasma capsulatum var. duboisii H88]